jgi:hypothetical protein
MKKLFLIIILSSHFILHGQKWVAITPLNDAKVGTINFTDSNTGYLNAFTPNASKILKTSDGGNTWKELLTINGEEDFDIIFFGLNDKVYFTGKNSIYLTNIKFEKPIKYIIDPDTISYLSSNIRFISLLQFTPKKLGAFAYGQYMVSRTSGEFWLPIPCQYSDNLQRLLTSITIGRDTIFAAGDRIIIKSFDRGETWESMPYIAPDNDNYTHDLREFRHLTKKTDRTIWAVGGGTVSNDWSFNDGTNKKVLIKLNSVNGEWQATPAEGVDPSETLIYINFFSNSDGVLVAEHGTVYITSDGGNKWKKILEGDENLYLSKVKFFSQKCGYAVGANKLQKFSIN